MGVSENPSVALKISEYLYRLLKYSYFRDFCLQVTTFGPHIGKNCSEVIFFTAFFSLDIFRKSQQNA
jgi:hypothetical protein